MKKLLTLCVACAALLSAACSSHRVHPHGMPPGQAKKITHLHGAGCGHLQEEGVWVCGAVGSNASRGPKK